MNRSRIVKPLEWVDFDLESITADGRYMVKAVDSNSNGVWRALKASFGYQYLSDHCYTSGPQSSRDAAKAAAQAEHEASVLESIVPASEDDLLLIQKLRGGITTTVNDLQQIDLGGAVSTMSDAADALERYAVLAKSSPTAQMREIVEGIVHFSDALNFRKDVLSIELRNWIAAAATLLKKEQQSDEKH